MGDRDTSIEAHTTDIEIVVAANGASLLCEVKKSALLPRQDVERFVSDMRGRRSTDGGPVLGGLFLSLRSPNILGKRAMALDMIDQTGQCLLYAGFGEEEECRLYISAYILLLAGISNAVHGVWCIGNNT